MKKTWIVAILLALVSMTGCYTYASPDTRIVYVHEPYYEQYGRCFGTYGYYPCYYPYRYYVPRIAVPYHVPPSAPRVQPTPPRPQPPRSK